MAKSRHRRRPEVGTLRWRRRWVSDRKKTPVWPEGRRDVRVGRTTRRLRALSKDLEEVLRTRRRRRRCCQRQLCSRWRSMEGRGRRVVELGEQLDDVGTGHSPATPIGGLLKKTRAGPRESDASRAKRLAGRCA